MSFENEFEEILKSVNDRKDGEQSEKAGTEPAIEPPKVSLNELLQNTETESTVETESEKEQDIFIPAPALNVAPAPENNHEPDEAHGEKSEKKSASVLNSINGSALKKAIAIVLTAIVLVTGAFCGVRIYNYSKTAYIREYEKKYNVDFPDGILKEMCEEYGKDQSFTGMLSGDGINGDVKVFSKYRAGYALLEKGSSITSDQHTKAIALEKELSDLESVYSSADGFMSASQSIEFDTLFSKDEYQVVAAYYTNTKPADDNGYVFPYNTYGTLTKKSFYQFQDRIKARRLYDTGYKLLEQNYILSISAPSDFMKDFRFVVVCVKAEDGFEKIKKAVPNEKIYYPQVWFDKNNKKNPYYLTGKWYPEIIINSEGKTRQLTAKDFE